MQPQKEQTIRQKLGSILGLGASRAAPLAQKSYEELGRQEHGTFFTADVLRELQHGVPLTQRMRAMKELHEIVATKHLEEHAVQAIWLAIKDLIVPSQPTEVRQTALGFTRALISGQFDDLGILRAKFFRVVQEHSVKEDTQQRLEILKVLTRDGKDIEYMEEAIGPFLVQWMPEVVTLGSAVDFLSLLMNFVHYNAAYLDEEVLIGLVQLTCVLANKAIQPDVIQLCLELLNAVVCYSSLPADALQSCVTTLCHTLNIERFSRRSLEVMLRLLGTHLGRSAIYTMCILIQERSGGQDALLLRGAVFYISMSMWGIRRVESLDLTFASVLPSIKHAVTSGHTIVVYEVCLSLRRLVQKYSAQLYLLGWELVYDTMAAIQQHIVQLAQATAEPSAVPSNNLMLCLQELFTCIEEVYEEGQSIGTPEKFFALVENSVEAMPLRSVLTLVSYRTKMINSTELGWVQQLENFMEMFYRREVRTAIRIEALNFLATVLAENALSHEDELMEGVVLPLLQPVAEDPDPDIRCRAVQLLSHLVAEASPTWAAQSLAIISSVLQKGLEVATENRTNREGPKLPDSKAAVFGLTLAFKHKLHCSSPVAAQIFNLLVMLLQQHYEEKCFLPTACVMRINTFNCVLTLRSNERGQLGYPGNDSAQFSPFLVCYRPSGWENHPSPLTPTLLDYRGAFAAVLACLKHECEWEVLVEVLHHLHGLLQDRTLTLSSQPDLSPLCTQLCQMLQVQDSRMKELRNVSSSWSKLHLCSLVYPVITSLCTYPGHLDRKAQHLLVCSLEVGLVGKSAQMCVSALSISSLELQATMSRLLPRVLYRLGQVAATPAMALPVLEFLSGLVPVPALYSGFVEQQYLSVFGIALPYTDPHKYPPYIIAMAHRVIAQWFVRCRIQYRPTMARFISKSLSVHVKPGPGSGGKGSDAGEGVGEELVEVCGDMMSRFTYSNLSTLPSRSSGAEFLLKGGHSKTWLVGNSLVTVTTSGQGGGRDGICSRCAAIRASLRPDSLAEASLLNRDSGVEGGEGVGGDGARGGEGGGGGGGEGEGGGLGPVLCSCWCRGWAEIKIRRLTGNISWLMRLQNRLVPFSAGYPLAVSDTGAEWSLLAANYPFGGRDEEGVAAQPGVVVASSEQHTTDESEQQGGGNGGGGDGGGADGGGGGGGEGNNKVGFQFQAGSGEAALERTEERTREEGTAGSGGAALERAEERTREEGTAGSGGAALERAEERTRERKPEEGTWNNIEEEVSMTEVASRESSMGPDDLPTPLASVHASPTRRPNPRSGREVLYPTASTSYPSLSSLEHLPPLLSYDEGDGIGRSPSLHGSGELLSEQEQLNLLASMSEGSAVASSSSSEDESDTPTVSEESEGPPLSLPNEHWPLPQQNTCRPHQPPSEHRHPHTPPQQEKLKPPSPLPLVVHSSPHPSLKRHASMPEEDSSPDSFQYTPAHLAPSPTPTRRRSTPVPSSHTPSSTSPAIGRKKLMFAQPPIFPVPSQPVGDSEVHNNPSFIFLQLYHTTGVGEGTLGRTPLLLPGGEAMERAVKVLDHIPPYDTHKIGVVYVGQGQMQEAEILGNSFGSSRYLDFLQGLGQLVWLSDCPPDLVYLGGLDRSGTDGQCAYFYQDEIMQGIVTVWIGGSVELVIFHVATLMPTHPEDPHCSNKKLHIGNDFVTVIYNDSSQPYPFGTIKGHFNFVEVVVDPLPGNMNRVCLAAKKGLEEMLLSEPSLISDTWLPVLVRQKALQANLASLVQVSSSGSTEHSLSNWLGRLHQIRRVREKAFNEIQAAGAPQKATTAPDFTAYS